MTLRERVLTSIAACACRLIEEEGARVVVDDVSLPLINGATLDWDEKLIGSKFQMLANPHAAGECGCKYSFTPKD